jgi:WD repeat-containing protein 35
MTHAQWRDYDGAMMYCAGVCWSPDSRLLLFSLSNGEVHVYDNQGGFVSKVSS